MTSAVVQVRFGGSPVMVDVTCPTDAAIDSFAAILRRGHGELLTSPDAKAAPWDGLLRSVSVSTCPGSHVLITCDLDASCMRIAGDQRYLDVLADNVDGVKELAADRHIHAEYFADHFYLGPSSTPAVFHR